MAESATTPVVLQDSSSPQPPQLLSQAHPAMLYVLAYPLKDIIGS
jgi:hypothetical protein